MPTQNHAEETHFKLLDTYEQPEEFKRVLEEALALSYAQGRKDMVGEAVEMIDGMKKEFPSEGFDDGEVYVHNRVILDLRTALTKDL